MDKTSQKGCQSGRKVSKVSDMAAGTPWLRSSRQLTAQLRNRRDASGQREETAVRAGVLG
jgi:hypothetical protein